MPSDEYSSFGKGALKLKGVGGKVKKNKKKDKKQPSDLEKNLSTGESSSRAVSEPKEDRQLSRRPTPGAEDGPGGDEAAPVRYKTEAERRFDEAKRKKVSVAQSPMLVCVIVG
jgi:protein FAM32A